ncbi:MAG TPA: glycosyltransferase [Phycisphaerae bacterium]|jgi:hypothetical protein
MPVAVETIEFRAIGHFAGRFRANCEELAGRYPDLARGLRAVAPRMNYTVGRSGDIDLLGVSDGRGVSVIPNCITQEKIAALLADVFPRGVCTDPLLVAGLDQGWLWKACYEISGGEDAGSYRPPLYLLVRELETLWVALHLHEWGGMLKDPRVELFTGPEAVTKASGKIVENGRILPPKICITVDPGLWPAGMSDKSLIDGINRAFEVRIKKAAETCVQIYGENFSENLRLRLNKGERLRILGITTRFSTFLQYSMRDWLAGWRSLGHEVHLLIEQGRHEVLSPVCIAETCAKFRPDLVVVIDHYRGELNGLLGSGEESGGGGPLSVMWIQDRLPNIYSTAAGAAQKERDYVMGYGRTEMVKAYGYPDQRFLPARIGVNLKRFSAVRLADAELSPFACDVSYVSHASTPAEVLVKQWMGEVTDAALKRLIGETFDRVRALYESGQSLTETELLRGIIDAAARDAGISLPAARIDDFQVRFFNQVNNALFRHQTLEWLAAMDLDLRLYGKGWEAHPKFRRYARGAADNWAELRAIYQATRINIQVTPFGALHQRLCDGVAAGGFFMLRYCRCDEVAGLYGPLWEWLSQTEIARDPDLAKALPAEYVPQLQKIERFFGRRLADMEGCLVPHVRELAADGFLESPVSLWPQYDSVAFGSRDELQKRATYFLEHLQERVEIADAMRQRVVEHLSYEAINRRLLGFVAKDLSKSGGTPE